MSLPKNEDEEVFTPSAQFDHHIVDQIFFKGYYRSKPAPADLNLQQVAGTTAAGRVPLYLNISIDDIISIDVKNECFSVRFHYIFLWEIDLHELGFGHIADRAVEDGHMCEVTESEITEISAKYPLPSFVIFNRVSHPELEGKRRMRVYGGLPGKTALFLGGESVTVTCRQKYSLKEFPFDLQELEITFRMLDPKVARQFNLIVSVVQFHRQAMHFTEWIPHSPLVRAGSPKYTSIGVYLQMERRPQFYVNNIWGMLTLLSFLGLTGFIVDPAKEQGNRTVIVVTLMLTAIAFKFSINDSLPAVPYATHMDYCINNSVYNLALIAFLDLFPSFVEEEEERFYLNLALGLFCVVLLLASQVFWFWRAYSIQATRTMTRPIEITGKNWYSFHFMSPPFLPDVTEEAEFVLPKRISRGASTEEGIMAPMKSQRSARDERLASRDV